MTASSREIRLAARPVAEPTVSDFALVEVPVPELTTRQLLVRNRWMSVDPYMRGRMWDRPSYVPPFQVGVALEGRAIGEVVETNDPTVQEGALVLHNHGWRDFAAVPVDEATPIDPKLAPPEAYLGVLGMPGMTAYVGLLDVAKLRDGDIVFVSAAAGAVGSLVCQIAKLRGHRVIGSAGSPEKVSYIRDELGMDFAFDYHDRPVAESLSAVAPDGVDLYFDNVGGDHLEAALDALRPFGRVALCGAIQFYNSPVAPPGIRNLGLAIGKRLSLRGFIVGDHADRRDAFLRDVGFWLKEGKVYARETVFDGLERAPDAFIGLFHGDNIGKMLVRIA